MRILCGIMLFVVLGIPTALTQNVGQMEQFAERLRMLEERLGIESTPQTPNWDTMLKRLEMLETRVYGEEPPEEQSEPEFIVAPPPGPTGALEWQEWQGTDADLPQNTMLSGIGMTGYDTKNAIRNFEQEGFNLAGYGVASYQYNEQQNISTFDANAFELALTGTLNEWALFAADLDFVNEGMDPVNPVFRHPSYNTDNVTGIYDTGGSGDDDDDMIIEQLYLKARPTDSLVVQAGKFNVPTGLEHRDPSSRFAVNPSLLWGLWPRDLTGIRATFSVTDRWQVSPYVFNGWDNDENINNSFLSAIYSSYQLTEDWIVGGTLAYGPPFADNDSDDALLIDFETRYTGIENLWLGLEYLYATAEADRYGARWINNDVDFWGALALANYRFHPNFGITGQASLVEDNDGFLYGTEQTRWELSLIPAVYFTDNLEIRFQYQHIESSDVMTFFQPVNERRTRSDSDNLFLMSIIWTY